MERKAECSCGQLWVACRGEPEKVSICHCDACRRRTGSAFGISVFYKRENAQAGGESISFKRDADAGFAVIFHFCPHCGSTLFWEPSRKPGMIGVAAGAFAEADFAMPEQSVWDSHRYGWIEFPQAMQRRPES